MAIRIDEISKAGGIVDILLLSTCLLLKKRDHYDPAKKDFIFGYYIIIHYPAVLFSHVQFLQALK